jgi:hypothetical protein
MKCQKLAITSAINKAIIALEEYDLVGTTQVSTNFIK